jgi:hypothetical protein
MAAPRSTDNGAVSTASTTNCDARYYVRLLAEDAVRSSCEPISNGPGRFAQGQAIVAMK